MGGRLLFVFGDTMLSAKAPDGTSLRCSTAAWSDPGKPLELTISP